MCQCQSLRVITPAPQNPVQTKFAVAKQNFLFKSDLDHLNGVNTFTRSKIPRIFTLLMGKKLPWYELFHFACGWKTSIRCENTTQADSASVIHTATRVLVDLRVSLRLRRPPLRTEPNLEHSGSSHTSGLSPVAASAHE